MNIVKNKNWYFALSALIIVPGVISLILFGLKLSIDFTGGSRIEYQINSRNEEVSQNLRRLAEEQKIRVIDIDENGQVFTLRTEPIEQNKKEALTQSLKKEHPDIIEKTFNTVGPTIGQETQLNAFKAVLIASIAIMAYIAFVFRKVSKPVASWKYGVCAIITLLHDVLIVVGIFSILGVVLDVEVDALFITALLTVMGFSVHDTIVVFDRIRENLRRNYSMKFQDIVNNSILETINRSLNTSITSIMVLFALILFGGESIRWFVAALIIGFIAGTYSSIFNASQLLVLWYEIDQKRRHKKNK